MHDKSESGHTHAAQTGGIESEVRQVKHMEAHDPIDY